jgi:entry exclusion lipoprotein TrbK
MTVQRRIATTARLGAALLLGASLLTGCEKKPEPVPEANEENCKTENLVDLKYKNPRQWEELAHKCARGSGPKPTNPEIDKW